MGAYIPKIKRVSIKGEVLVDSSGNKYVGEATKDYLGNIKMDNGQKLTSLPPVELEGYSEEPLVQMYRRPEDDDYVRGQYQRYFIRESSQEKIFEVDESTLRKYESKSPPFESLILPWYLTGEDAEQKNLKVIQEGTLKFQGIDQILLRSPKQFLKV